MHIPDEPPIGNLVAYEYLWLSQENTRDDGAKVYPVASTPHERSAKGVGWVERSDTHRITSHAK